jgi:hypothetical protein
MIQGFLALGIRAGTRAAQLERLMRQLVSPYLFLVLGSLDVLVSDILPLALVGKSRVSTGQAAIESTG